MVVVVCFNLFLPVGERPVFLEFCFCFLLLLRRLGPLLAVFSCTVIKIIFKHDTTEISLER